MLPYGRREAVTITSGNQVVEVPFPSRAYVDSIAVGQVGGTSGFTIDVFTKNPEDFGADSEGSGDIGPDPENVYLFCPRITVTAGQANEFFDTAKVLFNFDEPDATSRNQRKLYFRFNSINSGDFVLVVTGFSDMQ